MNETEFPVVEGQAWSGKTVSDGGEGTADAFLGNDGHRTWFVVVMGWFISHGAWLISQLGGLLYATSATSRDLATIIGAGSTTLDVGTGKAFGEGQYVTAHKFGDTTKLIHGLVTGYDTGTGIVSVSIDYGTGTGTVDSWVVRGSGPRGPQGVPGNDGADGTNGTNGTDGMLGIVEDTSPQLGGDLDANGSDIQMGDQAIERPVLKDYGETLNAIGNTSTACTIDLTLGNAASATLNGNCTFTFSNPSATGVHCSFILYLLNDGTPGRTTTWPASVKWSGGSQPSRSSDADDMNIYTFFTKDGGTTWYGSLAVRDPS